MTVRTRVAQLEKASPATLKKIVLLMPEDGTSEEFR